MIHALASRGGQVALELLLKAMQDEISIVRGGAVQRLGEQGEYVSLDLLLNAVYDEASLVRRSALFALRRRYELVPFEHIPHELILTALGDYEDRWISRTAAQLLSEIAPNVLSAVIPEAIAVLQGQPPGQYLGPITQCFIADVVGDMGRTDPELIELVAPLLDSSHWLVRMKAAQALGKLRRNIPDNAIQRLLELRRDPDPYIYALRKAADDALAEILSLESGIEDDD